MNDHQYLRTYINRLRATADTLEQLVPPVEPKKRQAKATLKPTHWTKKPENKTKLRRVVRAMAQARKKKAS